MTTLLYGRPPLVFDPPSTESGNAVQTSPLIPGSTALESFEAGSVDEAKIYAPPGVLERRYTLALALKALKVGGRLDVMAPKDKGGSRLKKELTAFGVEIGETAKAHHRRCIVIRPETMTGIDEAMIDTLVEGFYAKVREDDVIGPIFAAFAMSASSLAGWTGSGRVGRSDMRHRKQLTGGWLGRLLAIFLPPCQRLLAVPLAWTPS